MDVLESYESFSVAHKAKKGFWTSLNFDKII